MKKNVTIIILITFFLSLTGCATIFRGDSTKVQFHSSPEKAKVFINGKFLGQTPLKIRLKNDSNYTIEFRKEGFSTVTRQIHSKVGPGWVVLDVVCGLVPVLVDGLTGSWYYLDQKHVSAILARQQP